MAASKIQRHCHVNKDTSQSYHSSAHHFVIGKIVDLLWRYQHPALLCSFSFSWALNEFTVLIFLKTARLAELKEIMFNKNYVTILEKHLHHLRNWTTRASCKAQVIKKSKQNLRTRRTYIVLYYGPSSRAPTDFWRKKSRICSSILADSQCNVRNAKIYTYIQRKKNARDKLTIFRHSWAWLFYYGYEW